MSVVSMVCTGSSIAFTHSGATKSFPIADLVGLYSDDKSIKKMLGTAFDSSSDELFFEQDYEHFLGSSALNIASRVITINGTAAIKDAAYSIFPFAEYQGDNVLIETAEIADSASLITSIINIDHKDNEHIQNKLLGIVRFCQNNHEEITDINII